VNIDLFSVVLFTDLDH